MRTMIPAYEFRRRAREAMKPVMPILLVVALIATLPSLINNVVTLIADANPDSLMADFSNRLKQVTENTALTEAQMLEGISAAYDAYYADTMTFLREKGPLMLALSLMVFIVSPVLTLGMINALLHALRRQEFTAAIALSRIGSFFKVLGLELLLALKVLAWMLPGTALMLISLFLPETLMTLTLLVGLAVMLILGVRAGYRYALASFVLADEPERTIRGCIRRSCEVMKGRKMELFSLELSFLGWGLLLSLGQTLLLGMLGSVLGMALGMFASLFLTVYTNCAQAAFYQEYAVGPVELPDEQDASETNELI